MVLQDKGLTVLYSSCSLGAVVLHTTTVTQMMQALNWV